MPPSTLAYASTATSTEAMLPITYRDWILIALLVVILVAMVTLCLEQLYTVNIIRHLRLTSKQQFHCGFPSSAHTCSKNRPPYTQNGICGHGAPGSVTEVSNGTQCPNNDRQHMDGRIGPQPYRDGVGTMQESQPALPSERTNSSPISRVTTPLTHNYEDVDLPELPAYSRNGVASTGSAPADNPYLVPIETIQALSLNALETNAHREELASPEPTPIVPRSDTSATFSPYDNVELQGHRSDRGSGSL